MKKEITHNQALQAFEDLKGKPWFVKEAVAFLETIITKDLFVLEVGSGSSTVWFAERVKGVISFEESEVWYRLICDKLAEKGLNNVSIHLGKEINMFESDDFFDIGVIDGGVPGLRMLYVDKVISLLKSGGYLVFDNSDHRVYRDEVKIIDSMDWDRKDFKGKGYGTNPAHPWMTSVWRKQG